MPNAQEMWQTELSQHSRGNIQAFFEWLVWMSKEIEEEFVSVYCEMTGMADVGHKWGTFIFPSYIAVAIL